MKIMYHATDMKNLASILDNGLIANNFEGIVYLAEKPEDALKFVVLRCYDEIVLLKVKIYKKDEGKLIETFDHNPRIFKCRAFGFMGNIPSSNIEPYMKYDTREFFN